jgi:glycosyltransferase involved in cell wall biosynthesis
MKKYVIISNLDSFKFPLHEATRKQVWWKAIEKQNLGFEAEIILLSNEDKEFIHENVKIRFVNLNFWNLFLKREIFHVMTGTVSLWLLLSLFWIGKKKITLMDGDMLGYKYQKLRLFFVKFLPLFFRDIIVYSKYQKNKLKLGESCSIEMPILPIINIESKIKRSTIPTLLYMGHLSYFKGVDTIILAFKKLIIEIPDLTWVIANNGIRGDKKLIDEVLGLKKLYPDNIVIKGIVNPIEELSRAWIYLYPFKRAIGTMSFALSLYEAERCNTPYVACDVGANSEFFNPDYLIDVNDSEAMTKKIKYFIDERKVSRNI